MGVFKSIYYVASTNASGIWYEWKLRKLNTTLIVIYAHGRMHITVRVQLGLGLTQKLQDTTQTICEILVRLLQVRPSFSLDLKIHVEVGSASDLCLLYSYSTQVLDLVPTSRRV